MFRCHATLAGTLVTCVVLAASSGSSAAEFDVSGGLTLVGQSTDDSRIEPEITASADVYLDIFKKRRRDRLQVYFEGNSSLRRNGVSTWLPEANADAGTALDPDRGGRIQISELKYARRLQADGSLVVGLLDPSVYIDSTRINNDENAQFLGAGFVNNPAIELPDYTLGVAWERPAAAAGPGLNAVAASSHGIADNPNLSYGQLLSLDDPGKGAFVALEAGWLRPERLAKVGAWARSERRPTLDGSGQEARNFGIYGTLGAGRGRLAANLRLGLANPEVSLIEHFAAAAVQLDRGRVVLGLGLARSLVSDDAVGPAVADSFQGELYARVLATASFQVTGSLQHIRNSGFDASGAERDPHVTIVGMRLHRFF